MTFSSLLRLLSTFKRLISEGALVAGSRLPAERELAENFQVSRSSLRQALKVTPQTLYGKGDCAGDPEPSCYDQLGILDATEGNSPHTGRLPVLRNEAAP